MVLDVSPDLPVEPSVVEKEVASIIITATAEKRLEGRASLRKSLPSPRQESQRIF